jgi:hypothetical protein
MRRVPAIAHEQCGVFSSSQAFGAGWTRPQLSYATRIGRFVQLRPGAYQLADLGSLPEWDRARWLHAAPAIAVALVTPGAQASHSAAAVLHGVPLLFIPALPCVSVVPWHTGDVARAHLHRCKSRWFSLPVGEVPCTSIELTCIDMAREHGVIAGVVALDFVLHNNSTTLAEIYRDLDRCVRWPGVRSAREAISLANPLSESVLETRSRLKFIEFGLPEPAPQVRIGNELGAFVARVDFYWDEFGVVGEADGDVKYDGTEPEPLVNEKRRQGLLEDLDLDVVRWGNAELRNFEAVATRLRRAFGRAKQHPHSDRRWRVLPTL